MQTARDATLGGAADGVDGLLPCVTAIDKGKCAVVRRLSAVFHHHKSLPSESFKVVEQLVVDAVGACADDESDNAVDSQRFSVERFELSQRAVGVCICLKICYVAHVWILMRKKVFALFELFSNRFLWPAVSRAECLVVAIGATANAFRTVAIRARESGIYRNFLDLFGEMSTQERRKVGVASHSPTIARCG